MPFTASAANLRRVALIRLIVLAGQGGAIAYAAKVLQAQLPYPMLLTGLFTLALLTAFTFWRLRRSAPVTDAEFGAHLLADMTLLTLMLAFSGGANNPFVSYYLVPLSISAAILPARFTLGLALLSVMAYSLLLFWYHPLPELQPTTDQVLELHGAHGHHGALNLHILGMWFNFSISAALITAFVTRMARALREQQQELNRQREAALRHEQLVAVGTLAAGTAHELGTPMATLTVLADELLAEHGDKPGLGEDLALLHRQLLSCRGILRKLVATADTHTRSDTGWEPADRLLRQALERWQLLRPGVRFNLKVSAPGPAPLLQADPTLEQALINLLNNAADASLEPVDVTQSWEKDQVQIRLRDRGAGIDPARIEATAAPQPSDKATGLGLGLFLSHAAIERLGGSLQIEAPPGGGTEVRVWLPARHSQTETGSPP